LRRISEYRVNEQEDQAMSVRVAGDAVWRWRFVISSGRTIVSSITAVWWQHSLSYVFSSSSFSHTRFSCSGLRLTQDGLDDLNRYDYKPRRSPRSAFRLFPRHLLLSTYESIGGMTSSSWRICVRLRMVAEQPECLCTLREEWRIGGRDRREG
jgi:hypothetical protein